MPVPYIPADGHGDDPTVTNFPALTAETTSDYHRPSSRYSGRSRASNGNNPNNHRSRSRPRSQSRPRSRSRPRSPQYSRANSSGKLVV